MGTLTGLQEYLAEHYDRYVLDQAFESKELWEMHLYNHRIVRAWIRENLKYNVSLRIEGGGEEHHPKTDIKLMYPAEASDTVRPLLKTDGKVRDRKLEPIIPTRKRHHIKNKTLFPLMKERRVVLFTLLEGEVVRGLVAGFTRYEVTLSLKGGMPVCVFRHGVYDLRDKKGSRCYLKSFQETHRDWEKSDIFVPEASGT